MGESQAQVLDLAEALERLRRLGPAGESFTAQLARPEYAEAAVWFYGDGGTTRLPELEVAEVTLVHGDLHVEGSITDGLEMDGTFLGVTGSVRATDMATTGRVVILGDLHLERLLYGASEGRGFLEARSVRARIIADAGHRITAHAPPSVQAIRVGVDPLVDGRIFRPDACSEEGLADRDRVFDRIGAGKDALRGQD